MVGGMDYWVDLASSRLLRSLTRSNLVDELLELAGCESRVGHTIIKGQKVVLRIILLPQFPSVLPLVAMCPPPAQPLPHVGETGFVCYVQHEGLLLDESRPSVIITDAVRRSLAIIEQGLVGANHDDYREEFAYYWERGQAELIHVSSTFAPDSQVCPLRAWFRRRQDAYPFEISVPEAKPPRGGHHAIEGLYVPLLADASLLPPEAGSTWGVEQWREVINTHSDHSLDEVFTRLQNPQLCRFIVWGIPLPKSSNFVLVGSWLVSEEWGSRRWQHPFFYISV